MNEIIKYDSELEKLIGELENAATLKAMVMTGFRIGMAVAVSIVQEVLMQRARNMTDRPACPECGNGLESKGRLPRQLTTLIGMIRWKRKAWRCPNGCAIGQIAPFDDEIGLGPNQRTGDEIRETACCPAIFLPSDISALLLKTLTGITISSGCIWNWVEWAGGEAKAKLGKELEESKDRLPDAEKTGEAIAQLPLITGGDGVMVPFRPDDGSPAGKTVWHEVKVGIIARMGKRISQTGKEVSMPARKRVTAFLGNIDDFKPRMRLSALREGILEAETVVWLSDGGPGYWGVFYDLFADHAQGIPDFYHAAQNIRKSAKSWLDGRTDKAREWFACARKRLRTGRGQGVVNEINMVPESEEPEDSVRKTLENLVIYLTEHTDHISYDGYKESGLPIGSGMVESTCKWLIQQRFKGVGMRWSVNGFDNLLHLRLTWVNETYANLFKSICSPK